MKRLTVAVGVSTGLVFLAGPVAAQYRYTDDKGVSKVTQYKLDVPKDYRDAAVWVGATDVAGPASGMVKCPQADGSSSPCQKSGLAEK
jgi:hypothetical protein